MIMKISLGIYTDISEDKYIVLGIFSMPYENKSYVVYVDKHGKWIETFDEFNDRNLTYKGHSILTDTLNNGFNKILGIL